MKYWRVQGSRPLTRWENRLRVGRQAVSPNAPFRYVSTACSGTRNDRPTRTAVNSPECTRRYTVILETRMSVATSATVRNLTPARRPSGSGDPSMIHTVGRIRPSYPGIHQICGNDTPVYSVRSATTGSSFPARCAGTTPKMMPTPTDTPNASASDHQVTAAGTGDSQPTSSADPTPNAMPSTPPR